MVLRFEDDAAFERHVGRKRAEAVRGISRETCTPSAVRKKRDCVSSMTSTELAFAAGLKRRVEAQDLPGYFYKGLGFLVGTDVYTPRFLVCETDGPVLIDFFEPRSTAHRLRMALWEEAARRYEDYTWCLLRRTKDGFTIVGV